MPYSLCQIVKQEVAVNKCNRIVLSSFGISTMVLES